MEAKKEKVDDCIEFIGTRDNPYPYIKTADLIVQTSIYEGKSIVLDEAKILGKLIVSTDYPTVYDTIQNNVTGIISPNSAIELGRSIIKILTDTDMAKKILLNLKKYENGNVSELKKYLYVLFSEEI